METYYFIRLNYAISIELAFYNAENKVKLVYFIYHAKKDCAVYDYNL